MEGNTTKCDQIQFILSAFARGLAATGYFQWESGDVEDVEPGPYVNGWPQGTAKTFR